MALETDPEWRYFRARIRPLVPIVPGFLQGMIVEWLPTIYVAYADRALAAKCYQQADKAYRFVVERYTDDSVRVLREKAKLGVEDVRAKLK